MSRLFYVFIALGFSAVFGLFFMTTTSANAAELYSHWTFDEGSGDLVTDQGNGNVTGRLGRDSSLDDEFNPSWRSDNCLQGSCLYFDGNNDYVDLGLNNYIHNSTSSFSISIWAKGYGYQDDFRHSRGAFFGWMGYEPSRGVAFGPNNENDINFWVPVDANTLSSLIMDDVYDEGIWTHWVAVYDAAAQSMNVYKNGFIVDSTTVGVPSSIFADNNISIKIGDRGDGLVNFNGFIDEVMFFNHALSPSEVTDQFLEYSLPNDDPILEIIISNIDLVDVSQNTATIMWNTNVLTDSIIYYKKTNENLWIQTGNSSLTTSHMIQLSALDQATLYQFYIKSKDANDTTKESVVLNFTTQTSNDTTDSEIDHDQDRDRDRDRDRDQDRDKNGSDDNEYDDQYADDLRKKAICHREGNGIGNTLYLPEGSIKSHLRNHEYDYEGTCVVDVDVEEIKVKVKKLQEDMLDDVLAELQQLRDRVREQQNEIKYLKDLISDARDIAQQALDDINQFITYGIDENTKKLGEGERAAVIYSYSDAFGKLPETAAELEDAFKIANGRWPGQKSEQAEERARERFREIYAREYNKNNPNDNAAITVMAYGLRQKAENRNLSSEERGIETFKALFGRLPKSTEDWNIMQAITYSGATRDVDDVDGDGLSKRLEEQYGTDPNDPDSDGDGYIDGEEVVAGYSPLE